MHRKGLAALAFVALGLAACAGDSSAPAAGLTDTEARSLASSLSGLSGASALSASGMNALIGITEPIRCPAGGTARPDLRLSNGLDATHTGAIDVSGTVTLESCANVVDGQTLTTTGSITSSAHVSVAGGKPGAVSLTQKGSFDWSRSDGTRGSCSVDLSGSIDPVTLKASFSGAFCGRSIS